MVIQLILISSVLSLGVFFLKNRETMRTRAIIKLLLGIFIVFSTITILNPEILNRIANKMGVGRGTDLLLYMLFVAYVFSFFFMYLDLKKISNTKTKLARKIALLEKRLDDIDQE